MAEDIDNPWDVSEADFQAKKGISRKLRFVLNYAVLAPSSHNSQPWLFRINGDTVELYADRTRALPFTDPEDRALTISCGTALLNLRVALKHFGLRGIVRTLPDPKDTDLLARVRSAGLERASEEEETLFNAIKKRRTNRMPFEKTAPPARLIAELQEAAAEEGAWLRVVEGKDARNSVAELVAEGDRAQAANARFRRELAAWVHPNRTRSRDGMPGYALGLGGLASYAGPLILRTFDWGKGKAAKDHQLATGSPVLAVLGSDEDNPRAWLAAGQALERALLKARSEDVWASYLNQPIEVADLRSKLAGLIGTKGFPQLLLRLGYGQDVKPTPRRRVGEVLL